MPTTGKMKTRTKAGRERRKPGPRKLTSNRYKPDENTRGQVLAYASMGTPQDDICLVLRISKPTLVKYYRHELDTGLISANAQVARSLFNKATNPSIAAPTVAAGIWWEKTRGGRSEKVVNEHGGIDGAAINVIISKDDAKL